ncbi:cytochrome P450 monooxygenase pc-bph [Dacryopinax primogenitus]|uniref:Cytochrome P450 monooxygenase pc-bph n=1 Tax=Dacryopinax primogenitus (strain DJM 731) TaxID=1858805 RepID=M5GC39_DACPD|nr:cytochrome P450 monooxygenase pc-bph [Dacryopinax primogenitus]EJU01598.1 cytochrome P450 monooxygenase pc-bph [Dacryopinax primogenitus]
MSSLLDYFPTPFSSNALLLYGGLAVLLLVASHLVPWVADPFGYRKKHIPGPFLAQLSDVWLARVAAQGHRSEIIHGLHQKYGKVVRIAPNHISLSEPGALQIVYAHGNGALKSDFYEAFVSIRKNIFSTRDRAEHTRKRKIVSHIFSQKSVLEFEPYIRQALGKLVKQWDSLLSDDRKLASHRLRPNENGTAWFDCLNWYNYLAFDIIGDLAFGEPFGMINSGADSASVAIHGDDPTHLASGEKKLEIVRVPAVKILNDRGEYSASMGCLPIWIRPYAKKIPWYAKGNQAVKNLAGIAIAAVDKRLATPTDRVDLLARLQQGKDEQGNLMARSELTAEALAQLIAGSDTTSNSSCAITYWLAKYPDAQRKLQKELDEALGDDEDVPTYEQLKRLRYLDAVVNEGLRIHSTSSLGLPRIVPEGGLEVSGIHFPAGSVLSVPSYTIHRDTAIWGPDPDIYRPERWFEQDAEGIQATFNAFSFGPRACVGKNLASMELLLIVATIFHRYEFALLSQDQPLETREGFLRKPVSCYVGMKRRST